MLETRCLSYSNGPVPIPKDDQCLVENVQSICICDTGMILFIHIWCCLRLVVSSDTLDNLPIFCR